MVIILTKQLRYRRRADMFHHILYQMVVSVPISNYFPKILSTITCSHIYPLYASWFVGPKKNPHQDRFQRQVQSFQLKATQLEDAVADHTMSEERRRKSLNVAWREEVMGCMELLC